MKILKLLLCSALLLGLCACSSPSEPVWEYVEDDLVASAAEDAPYALCVFIPQGLTMEENTPASTGERYLHEDGDYSISTRTLLGTSAEEVITWLTDCAYDQLTVLQTSRFGLPEYRFSWYEEQDGTGYACRGDVIQDGDYFYVVKVAVKEDLGGEYRDLAAQVFASIGLNSREM